LAQGLARDPPGLVNYTFRFPTTRVPVCAGIMACAQRLALALLGLAAVGCGMSIHRINGSVGKPKFDPTSDSVLVYARPKTGTNTLQDAVGGIMQPPCDVPFNRSNTFRAMKCHLPDVAANFVKHRKKGSRTWVIISVRNPFSRYLSGFFQHLTKPRKSWPNTNMIKDLSMKDYHRLFHERVAKFRDPMKHPYDYLGLDLKAHPFDFNKKFLHVSHEWKKRHLEIIIVRLEDSSLWESILKEFFPTIRIGAASNVASQGGNGGNKVLAKKHQKFLKTMQWTKEEIEWISQAEQISHFYTKEEREAFIDRANNASSRLAAHTDIDEFSVEDADDFSEEDDSVEDEDSEDRTGKHNQC